MILKKMLINIVKNRHKYINSIVVLRMAKHHPDRVFCIKQPGIMIGILFEKCDGNSTNTMHTN